MTTQRFTIQDFPNEIIHMILEFLSDKDSYNSLIAFPLFTMPNIHRKRRTWKKSSISTLAKIGDLQGVKYLLRFKVTTENSEFLNFINNIKYDFETYDLLFKYEQAIISAALNGHVNVVKFLINSNEEYARITTFANTRCFDFIKIAISSNNFYASIATYYLCLIGDLELLIKVLNITELCRIDVFNIAVNNGNNNIVRYLLSSSYLHEEDLRNHASLNF